LRVHGNIIIKRRDGVKPENDYHKYLDELSEDFGHICGYCGKSEAVTKNTFELDHFIPQRCSHNRVNDYTNLVYSCFICNRKKSRKMAFK
jgi:5-methylcytosine-specific restriction endonuclease McrA